MRSAQSLQHVRVYRLDQVVIEFRLVGAFAVFALAVSGQSDQNYIFHLRVTVQVPGHLIAICNFCGAIITPGQAGEGI